MPNAVKLVGFDQFRKKLIELVNGAIDMREPNTMLGERIADHLIANGVTLDNQVSSSKWVSVTERLPEVGKTVIALGSRGGVYTAQYTGGVYWHKLNARCHMCEPTHWMPLPEPPKEGE